MPRDPRKYMRIYAAVKNEIVSGTLPVETHLHIGDLAERFGTSRDSVQSALRLLAAEQLVSRWPGVGWFVNPREDWRIEDEDDESALRKGALKKDPPPEARGRKA